MKVFVVFAVTMVACAMAGAGKEKALEIRAKCKTDVGATDDDLKEIEEKHELNTDISKKMMACVFTEAKVMQDNKFSKEGALNAVRFMLADKPDLENKIKVAEDIADKCVAEIGDAAVSGEEMAKKIFDCLKKQAVEHGLKPPVFKAPSA